MALDTYKQKRNFKVTPEPAGKAQTKAAAKHKLQYVIQKHRATSLHYDFRLEHNGVLLSWAVPKGPSLDASVKRLAMHVEDHPLEYGGFEGIIPEGEYGGGTVMVWDNGYWEPEGDVETMLQKGDLKFTLYGKKLHGSWVLVRTRGFGGSDKSWLLIKHRDEFASTEDILEREPRSVLSNRLLAEIAEDSGGNVTKAATGDPAAPPAKAAEPKKKPAGKTAKPKAKKPEKKKRKS